MTTRARQALLARHISCAPGIRPDQANRLRLVLRSGAEFCLPLDHRPDQPSTSPVRPPHATPLWNTA
jgi:hypothetical protein